MSEYYKIKETTLTGIADNVRRLIGSEETINFGEIEAIMEGIEVGGGGIDTGDATAVANEIFKDKTAYVDGEKITGTFTIDSELNSQDDLLTQIEAAIENKTTDSGIDTSDATATPSDILSSKTAYVDGEKITGTLTVKSVYIGTDTPTNDIGNDGDIYIVRSDA